MKDKTLFFSLMAASSLLFAACSGNATSKDKSASSDGQENAGEAGTAVIAKGSIVYFNLDQVLEEYDMANELRSEVEAKVSTIQKDVDRRQKNLENAVKDFTNKVQKGLMTSSVANEQQKKLSQQEASFQQFAQQKQNEILEEQQVMMNRIADAIKTFIENYNEDKEYSMILSNQNGIPVIAADPNLDITQDIIKGLNAEYVKAKNAD